MGVPSIRQSGRQPLLSIDQGGSTPADPCISQRQDAAPALPCSAATTPLGTVERGANLQKESLSSPPASPPMAYPGVLRAFRSCTTNIAGRKKLNVVRGLRCTTSNASPASYLCLKRCIHAPGDWQAAVRCCLQVLGEHIVKTHPEADHSEVFIQSALYNGEQILLCRAGMGSNASIKPSRCSKGRLLEPVPYRKVTLAASMRVCLPVKSRYLSSRKVILSTSGHAKNRVYEISAEIQGYLS